MNAYRIMRAGLIGLSVAITGLGIAFSDTHEGGSLILCSLKTTPGSFFVIFAEYMDRRRS